MYELCQKQDEVFMEVHQIKVIIIGIFFSNIFFNLCLVLSSDERRDELMAIVCCLYMFFVAYLTFTNYETYEFFF